MKPVVRCKTDSHCGAALLEALIALAILSVAAASALGAVTESLQSARAMIEREQALDEAHHLMKALSLLSRTDLDLRLGRRELRPYIVDVQRPRPTLYRIAVVDPAAPDIELLVTVVFRQEPTQ